MEKTKNQPTKINKKMVEIKNVAVYDFKESVIACRNAMRTQMPDYTNEEFEASLQTAMKLVGRTAKDPHVKCHDNFLTGIRVSFDIIYPQYFSPELQRYHFADIVTSASKMHRLMSLNLEKCCNKYVSQVQIDECQKYIDTYNRLAHWPEETPFSGIDFTLRDGSVIHDVHINDALYHARILALSNCPSGLELFMRVSTNYKQLQTIYWQRRDHRLIEDWREGFIGGLIRKLPYYKEFITGGEE